MANPVEQAGIFRAEITNYGSKEYPSGAIAINAVFRLTETWYTPEGQDEPIWGDCSSWDQEAFGNFFVVKKDGTLNSRAVESLTQNAGWDGSFESITNGTWKTIPCQIEIKSEMYDGAEQFKVAWLNAFDSTPGMQSLSAEASKKLNARFGGQIRALAGDSARAASKPSSPPPKAPTPPSDPNAELQQDGHGQTGPDGSIPF